jgi:hypothetical protein
MAETKGWRQTAAGRGRCYLITRGNLECLEVRKGGFPPALAWARNVEQAHFPDYEVLAPCHVNVVRWTEAAGIVLAPRLNITVIR